MKQDEEH